MSENEDRAFIRTFGVIMGVIGVIALIALFTANIVTNDTGDNKPRPEEIALAEKHTDPMYVVVTKANAAQLVAVSEQTGGSSGGASQGKPKSGEYIFKHVCHVCHVPGLMGAPKVSDTAEWKKRYGKGIKTLYKHAIHGFHAMPPKGGHPELSDKEVKATVDYILHRAGVK